jgi:hypothetical protein
VHASLRPLGVGEMLDRAVTLSVRYFVPFASIWAVFYIPVSILAFFGVTDMTQTFTELTKQLERVQTATHPDPTMLALQPHWTAATIVYFVVALAGYPLAMGALLHSASEAYLEGHAANVRPSYAFGVAQWLPLAGVGAIWIAVGIVIEFVLFFCAVLVGLLVAVLGMISKPAAFAVGIPLGIAGLVALLILMTIAVLAFFVSMMTQITENTGFVRAFSVACGRVMRTRRTAIPFGLALLAVNIGFSFVVFAGQALLFGLLHSNVAGISFSALVGIVGAVFTGALTVVYYYDVRVRSEGYDLSLEAADDAAASPA